MPMDFFEHQDAARRKTGKLVWLFIAAVLAIIAMVYLLFAVVMGALHKDPQTGQIDWSAVLDPGMLLAIAGGTILVVGLGTFYKLSQLSHGGHVIAEALGGQPVGMNTPDQNERKLLNVVEEMAIASGTPVPPVFVMQDEQGINAFAAGLSPDDAVIGVTRGCIDRLSRDQLQGVIAHEFSHILNGDMRLKFRLIGILYGILMIGIIGYYVLRSAMYSGGRRRGKNDSGAAIVGLGIGLMIIGFMGTFFGSIIKAAVSRQREFLADASAVQFTRNPEGIGGALATIAEDAEGGHVNSPAAPEVNHMFFVIGLKGGLSSLFATHPPIEERIRRIGLTWEQLQSAAAPSRAAELAAAQAAAPSRPAGATGAPIEPQKLVVAAALLSQIGAPTQDHISYAQKLVEALPDQVKQAAHEPYGARAVIYALLVDEDPEPRRLQLDRLAEHADPGVNHETNRLLPMIEQLSSNVRLPLIDMAIPALRSLSADQYQAFKDNVKVLVAADKKIDLFEWTLQRIMLHHLEPRFSKVKQPKAKYASLGQVTEPVEVLLSTLAYVGHDTEEEAAHAFGEAGKHMDLPSPSLQPRDRCGLKALDDSLNELVMLAPQAKRQLITAAAACIAADQKVTTSEAELLRAFADSLNCPMPPLLPGQPLM